MNRLSKSADFENVKLKGKLTRSTRWLVANILNNKLNAIRVGWTIPSYVGTAVMRNKFKRWMREYLKGLPTEFRTISLDINVVLRKESGQFYKQLEHRDFNEALEKLFRIIITQNSAQRL